MSSATGRSTSSALLPSLFLLVLLLLWSALTVIQRSEPIAGERYWWLVDDAMISMRYAKNLSDGLGLVWNAGERVEGYSNFLWTAFMGAVHLLPIPSSKTSLAVLLGNLLLAALTVVVLHRFVRRIGGGTFATVATLGAYVLNRHTMAWCTMGSEAQLATLLFLVALDGVLKDEERGRPSLSTYAAAGLLSLVRSDAVVLTGLVLAFAAARSGSLLRRPRERRSLWAFFALALAFPPAHVAFRLLYYGALLPNTAYLKVMGWEGRYASGLAYLFLFLWDYLIPLLFCVAGLVALRRRPRAAAEPFGSLLALVFLYGFYLAYVGGDVFPYHRFFVPVIPVVLALAFFGIERIAPKRTARVALTAICLASLPLVGPRDFEKERNRSKAIGNIRIGLLLKENTADTARVADYWAGSVLYFSERYGIDLLGKSDPHIARLPAVAGDLPGHNKFDFDYSLGVLRPDYVVAAFRLPVDEAYLRRRIDGDSAWQARLYFHPLFREHCLPYPVAVETWRTIFACDWSPEVEKRSAWSPLDEGTP